MKDVCPVVYELWVDMCTAEACYCSFHALGKLVNQAALSRLREAVDGVEGMRALELIRYTLCALLKAQNPQLQNNDLTYLSEML